MSTITPHPALPRQPLGKTFVTSMVILGVVAVTQVLGLVAHYAGDVRKQLVTYSTRVPEVPAPRPVQQDQEDAAPVLAAKAPPAIDGQKVQKLLADVDHNIRIGEFDAALKTLEDLEAVEPGDPSVLLKKAAVLERLDQNAEAVVALKAALSYPGLSAQTRALAQRKLEMLARDLPDDAPTTATAGKDGAPDGSESEVRDESGIQPGSSLGIVDIRLRDVKSGVKGLRVAVKSLPSSNIDVKDVKVVVYFYEQSDDGEVNLTNSKPISQWLSPPIDWANNEPELLEMQYTSPGAGDADAGRKYYGYIVGIYYNGELQDFRADPARLAHDFALPLYLKQGSGE